MGTEVIQSQCIRKLTGFSQRECDADLTKIEQEQWVKHVNKNDYDGKWSVIALRTLKQNEHQHPILQCYQIQHGDDWVDLPLLNELATVNDLLNQIPFKKKSVRLMKLDPGAVIKEHTDGGLSMENGEARLHVPLQSDENVIFMSDGKALKMSQGELWYINADAPHSVRNEGQQPRINLVVDCELTVDEWQQFTQQEA